MLFYEHPAKSHLAVCCTTHTSSTTTFECLPPDSGTNLAADRASNRMIPAMNKDTQELSMEYQKHITSYSSRFAIENELGETSAVRTWGLAGSPSDRWIASSISLHPEDMIQYLMPGNERSVITFVKLYPESHDTPASANIESTMECMLQFTATACPISGLGDTNLFAVSAEGLLFEMAYADNLLTAVSKQVVSSRNGQCGGDLEVFGVQWQELLVK